MSSDAFNLKKDIHSVKPMSSQTSVAIISFHKCATSFLSNHVINKSKVYHPIDYQSFQNKNEIEIDPIINKKGYIYGVLRVYDQKHPGYQLTIDLLHHKNIKKIKTIFWVRDPRDILISMYYSFGFTHGFSSNQKIKKYQEKRRSYIQRLTIDEYVINEAYVIRKKFNEMYDVMEVCENKLFLKYEDMIHRYDYFYDSLNQYLVLDENMKREIYERTKPNDIEDQSAHKRSGKTGGHIEKLKPQTVVQLHIILADTLQKFGY